MDMLPRHDFRRYTWTIKNFSSSWPYGEPLQSQIFSTVVNNTETKWIMQLIPDWPDEDSLCLYLTCLTMSPCEMIFTNFEFSIVNPENQCISFPVRCKIGRYTYKGLESPGFITRNLLMSKPYLFDDNLRICGGLPFLSGNQILPTDYIHLKEAQDKLTENFHSLLDMHDMSDVTLLVDGREFHAHKCILSARSPVFSAMFRHQMKESIENKVQIDDLKAETFQIVLEYIYTAKTPNLHNMDELEKVMYAANKYDLVHLATLCQVELSKVLSVDNAAKLLILADFYNANILKQRTTNFITTHHYLHAVLETEGWKSLKNSHPSLLAEIEESIRDCNLPQLEESD